MTAAPAPTTARAGRCPRRPLPQGASRPSDVLVRFLANGVAYLVAAGAAGVWDTFGNEPRAHWLALHLAFVGAVSLMVLGASQFFATAFLMTVPPPKRLIRAQLATWNLGTILVAVGVFERRETLTDIGAVALLAGLVFFTLALRGLMRSSLQRAHWAVRWYMASALCLGAGAILGALMARGTWIDGGSILGAHIALNVGGWFGTAIVGTLHTFYPSLTHTPLRHPRLQAPAFGAWVGGVLVLALGYALGADAIVVLGWLSLAVAATLLATNLIASRRAATDLRLPARLVGAAQPFLVAGLVVALVGALHDGWLAPLPGPQRDAVGALLVTGWVGLTVSGSLLHLLSILSRVRTLGAALPAPTPRRDVAITVAAVIAVTATALSQASALDFLASPARLALAAVAATIAVLLAAELRGIARAFIKPGPPLSPRLRAPAPAGPAPRRAR